MFMVSRSGRLGAQRGLEGLFRSAADFVLRASVALALSIPALFGFGEDIAAARTLKLVAFGDSLTAGYELPPDAAFPAVLEKAMRHDGYDVTVLNAGVSGDTAANGLARLDWSLQGGVDGAILELGANDMLRGLSPAHTEDVLGQILAKLRARHIRVLIAGMLASPSLGADYQKAFDDIYPKLAAQYGAPLYPFFLNGVVGRHELLLPDGMHPNAAGVKAIVAAILPTVEAFVTSMLRKT